LNEFIENAIEFEEDLASTDTEKFSEAVETLSDLSSVLCLPQVSEILTQISQGKHQEREALIEILYHTLSRLSTAEIKEEIQEEVLEEIPEKIQEKVQEIIREEPIETTKIAEVSPLNENSFGRISLEGIRPKHFDFQLEEAANDLSLPVELIEEFVHDFIDQAHVETKKMLENYEKGDLDAIQKIGHLLKGASSNLRIGALSDTLYKIQFCERAEDLEGLIKDYWAHFLSFEHQINVISG
jgi:HPt (histidine-containing phosphotransfer) domain-containing protein